MGQGRNIPNRLRKYRRLSGFKQKEVAGLLGLRCANRLSKWEQGRSHPNLKNVLKLSVLYKTLIEELYFDMLKETRLELSKVLFNKKP